MNIKDGEVVVPVSIEKDIREIRESQIRTEEHIRAMGEATDMRFKSLEKRIEIIEKLETQRCSDLRESRKFITRAFTQELVKLAVTVILLLIGLDFLK